MGRTSPNARVILDSISSAGHRLTTLEVTFHRFVLAEFNTHRMFSRNSASSRAIPIEKQLFRVRTDLAYPIEWGRNQKGMQAGLSFEGREAWECRYLWAKAADAACQTVEALQDVGDFGLHKQVANRLLEPFMWQTVLVTATEWQNFFRQRCHPDAQPEMRVAAQAMYDAYLASTPVELDDGDWHTPLIQPDEIFVPMERRQISTGRCARVSYMTHEGVRDPGKDLELFDRLANQQPPHASPLEHIATPWHSNVQHIPMGGRVYTVPKLGNFLGWAQSRHELGV